MNTLLAFILANRTEMLTRLGEHVVLVLLSTLAAAAIAIPLGVVAARRPLLARPIVAAANLAQTIPSLALFGFLIPLPLIGGIGTRAALIALTRSLVREEQDAGVRATAVCPAFVDTPMATWTGLESAQMIQPDDCAEVVRSLLRLSPAARVPVVVIERAGTDAA